MIDFIGGLFGMAVGYAGPLFLIAMLCCIVMDHGKSYITSEYNHKDIMGKLNELVDEIPEGLGWMIFTAGTITIIVTVIGCSVTGMGDHITKNNGYSLLDFALFPYWAAGKVSWIIVPLGIWASVLIGGKAIYEVTQKVSKLKRDIQEHIRNGGH